MPNSQGPRRVRGCAHGAAAPRVCRDGTNKDVLATGSGSGNGGDGERHGSLPLLGTRGNRGRRAAVSLLPVGYPADREPVGVGGFIRCRQRTSEPSASPSRRSLLERLGLEQWQPL